MWIESMNSFKIQCITEGRKEIDTHKVGSNATSLTGTSGKKITSTSSTMNVQLCLRHDPTGVYSGPISVLVTLALIAQWTAFVSVSTLV